MTMTEVVAGWFARAALDAPDAPPVADSTSRAATTTPVVAPDLAPEPPSDATPRPGTMPVTPMRCPGGGCYGY